MECTEFGAELRRMANDNGIHFVREDQLLRVMGEDIAAGADFINIIPSFAQGSKNTFLLINSRSVLSAKTGILGPKVAWSTLITQIKSARATRSAFGSYIIDELCLDTSSGAREFTFGFSDHLYDGHKAEIAQKNAQVAAHEVTLAMDMNAIRPVGSQSPVPRAREPEQIPNDLAAQLRRFIRSQSPGMGTGVIGQPFGAGLGLEGSMAALPQFFTTIETMRDAGEMMAMTIIGATGQGQIAPDDLSYVMGTASLRSNGLTADQATAAENLAGAARAFLGQLHEPGASMWELWKSRADVAGEFLCWHAVAWGRLAALGRVDPIGDLLSSRRADLASRTRTLVMAFS